MHQLSNVQGRGGREPYGLLKTSLSLRGPQADAVSEMGRTEVRGDGRYKREWIL